MEKVEDGGIREDNESFVSIEDILTIQSGGRIGIPKKTLQSLDLHSGDTVFVKITKAVISKAGFEKE